MTDIASPYTPFTDPIPPPETDPSAEGDLHLVCFDRAWLSVVLACLGALADPTSWEGDPRQIRAAARAGKEMLVRFMEGCTAMVDFDPCCQDEIDLLEAINDVLSDNRSTLRSLLDCCKSLGSLSGAQLQDLQDQWVDDLDTDPTLIDEDIPPGAAGGDLTDDQDDINRRQAALCWALKRWCEYAWEQAEFEYLRFFNLLEDWVPQAHEVTGAVFDFLESLFGGWTVDMFHNEEAKREVICCLLEGLSRAETTGYLTWSIVAEDCRGPLGSDRYNLASIIWASILDSRNMPALLRLIGQGYRKILTSEKPIDADCHCNSLCYDWGGAVVGGWRKNQGTDFEVGTGDNENFRLFDDIAGSYNTYALGVYGTGTDLSMHLELPQEYSISYISYRVYYDGNHVNVPWSVAFFDEDKNLLHNRNGSHSGGTGWTDFEEQFTPVNGVKFISVFFPYGFTVALDLIRFDQFAAELCPDLEL